MPIVWSEEAREFHLHNGRVSYVLNVNGDGSLGQRHFGGPLDPSRSYAHLSPREFQGFSNRLGDPVRLEYPTPGSGDYRMPALVVEQADGSAVLRLRYRHHAIRQGKPGLGSLPAAYVEDEGEADTLEVTAVDEPSGLEVLLRYTIFRDLPILARSARLTNRGAHSTTVRAAMSASLDLPDADWHFVGLAGTWARERHMFERRLTPGRQSLSSTRGASGHQQSPVLLLKRPCTTEDAGEAAGMVLVYSGNFLAEVEVDPFETTRLRIGINPEGFAWRLEPGASFETPEAIIGFSEHGLGDLSDAFHRLLRERVARGHWRDRARPVLINNWEGTYFDFDEAKLVDMAAAARQMGVELFVLDDGWFGERNDDTSSLGDWFVNTAKLPGGLEGLAAKVRAQGLEFGLWIEPEMISPRSRLFEDHPDWAIGIPGRDRTESRNQYVLDMSRPEIVEHLFRVLSGILGAAPISYVKWDMNRNITEPYSLGLPAERQGEFFHRYILGVYELYRRLTEAFQEILFESCAGGGGRFDAGLLAFAPQAWTSDDTDAVERLKIQWGTSLCFPLSSMGAHVSAVPNHQVGRITPLAMRGAVAFFGDLGYELDPTALSEVERRDVAGQIAFYKEHRDLFQRGRFVRLHGLFEGDGNETAWMVVSDDARRAVVGHYRMLNRPSPAPARLRLRGLNPGLAYRVTAWPSRGEAAERANEVMRGGDDLAKVGLFLDVDPADTAGRGDFYARLFVLEAAEG